MKSIYKFLMGISMVVVIGAVHIKKYIGTVESLLGNAVGTLAFLLPILVGLVLFQKEPDISPGRSIAAKLSFWFLIFIYCGGLIAKLIEKGYL